VVTYFPENQNLKSVKLDFPEKGKKDYPQAPDKDLAVGN